LNTPPVQRPVGVPTTSSVLPTTTSAPATSSASTTASCTSAQLRAVGSMQGAAGSRDGALSLTNFSDVTCTLQGQPTITLMDGNLKPITSGVTFTPSPPGWRVNGSPQPAGWPVVTLR